MGEETDGFKFAITLLATFGTILYVAYNYFQRLTVDVYLYAFVSGVIAVLIISAIILISYVMIKGLSLEMQDDNLRNTLEHYASDIYFTSFLASSITLVFIASVFFGVYTESGVFIAFLITTIAIIIVIFLSRHYLIKRLQRMGFVWAVILVFIVFLAILLPWIPLFDIILSSPLQGHVTIDMDSIYYKNGAPIPIFIQITGPNTGLSTYLYKENSEHKLTRIDHIDYLDPKHNLSNNVSDEHSILTGNSLENGKYNVFINTSNLSEGYYEVVSVRYKYEAMDAKGFYILNSSR